MIAALAGFNIPLDITAGMGALQDGQGAVNP